MVLINELIGEFGRYHFFICCVVFISKFGAAFHTMAFIFLAPPANYKCPNTNETCCDNPVFDKSVFTRTIVMEWSLICEKAWFKDFHQTLFQFGVLSGSFFFGILSDMHGRKPTLTLSVLIEIFTGIISSFLPDFWSFTIIRVILGFSVGGVMVIGFVLIMEYVGHKHRDVVSVLFHLPFTMGHLILALFGYYIRDYMYLQLAISASTLILAIYICVLPESPRWLLARNKTVKAATLIEFVAKMNRLPTEEIAQKIELYQFKHKSSREKRNVLDLFRTPNIRKNILVMSFVWLVCSYCFYGMSYYISHLTGDVFINVMASGAVCMFGCLFAVPVIKFMNRRTIVILGNALSSVFLLIIAFVPEGKGSVVLGCLGIFFSYIVFVVVYLYCSEMFPTVVRNAAIGICSMMARLGAMVAPFLAGLRPFGQWCAPVAFGIMPLIAACLCLMLPETKDCELIMTIEEGEALGKKPSIRQNIDSEAQ